MIGPKGFALAHAHTVPHCPTENPHYPPWAHTGMFAGFYHLCFFFVFFLDFMQICKCAQFTNASCFVDGLLKSTVFFFFFWYKVALVSSVLDYVNVPSIPLDVIKSYSEKSH